MAILALFPANKAIMGTIAVVGYATIGLITGTKTGIENYCKNKKMNDKDALHKAEVDKLKMEIAHKVADGA